MHSVSHRPFRRFYGLVHIVDCMSEVRGVVIPHEAFVFEECDDVATHRPHQVDGNSTLGSRVIELDYCECADDVTILRDYCVGSAVIRVEPHLRF